MIEQLLEEWRHQYYLKMNIYTNYAIFREELRDNHLKVILDDLI